MLLFSFVLIGNLDASVFRYLLLMNDFIDLVNWQEVDDFQAFGAVIYPFLHVRKKYYLNMSCIGYYIIVRTIMFRPRGLMLEIFNHSFLN